MRHILAIVPQHIPYPEHQQLAHQAAFTPYGTSTAAAIVACCLYFVFFCCAIANYVYTKYPFYDVLIISTAFRTAAFAVRAAYTVQYQPALSGVWLAFNNAGFGANIATLCLALGTWLNKVGHLYYGKKERIFYTVCAYILVASVISFGPICGVIAAGLEYGDYCCYGSTYGERLRFAATYAARGQAVSAMCTLLAMCNRNHAEKGLEACVFGLMLLSLRLSFSVFLTQANKSGKVAATQDHPQRQPRLVILFFACAMFLAIRGATGAVAIYLPYQQYWIEDRLFYSLDTFPEYLVLLILSWPAFMARMAQAYPRAAQGQGKTKKNADIGSKADQQQG